MDNPDNIARAYYYREFVDHYKLFVLEIEKSMQKVVPAAAPIRALVNQLDTRIKSIIEKTSLSATQELTKVVDMWMQQTLAGPSPEEQQITNTVRKLGIEEKQLDNELLKAKVNKTVEETSAVKKNADVNSLNALTNSYESGHKVRVDNERVNTGRAAGKKQGKAKDV
jgi:hypothetical protein